MGTTALKVDVEKALQEKRKNKSKPPKYLVNILRRIAHEDELNAFLDLHGDKMGLDFVKASIEFMELKVHIVGSENIPEKGRFVFVANHPIGGLDGLAVIAHLGNIYPTIKGLANDILMNIKNLHSFFLPVNKTGNQARDSARMINEMYKSDDQIFIFPAGLVSRRKHGKIEDLEWKKSFVSKSISSKRDIVPIHISGRVTNFFYNLAYLRALFGIKTNIEMLFLPHEMFKLRNKSLTLTFGKPISYQTLDSSKTAFEWAQAIKQDLYKLGEQ